MKSLNLHGGSGFSNELTIKAATIPDKMAAPTLTDPSTSVVISWVKPNINGDEVTSYIIKILNKNTNTYVTDALCDGADSTIFTNKQCSILITQFTSTFGYTVGQPIKVIAIAVNTKG